MLRKFAVNALINYHNLFPPLVFSIVSQCKCTLFSIVVLLAQCANFIVCFCVEYCTN